MRALRSVTLAPIGMPSRTLKVAIDFRARVIDRLLAGDQREIVGRELHLLGVGGRLADAHVEHDLVDARHAVAVLVAELLVQLRHHHVAIICLQPRLVVGRHRGLFASQPPSSLRPPPSWRPAAFLPRLWLALAFSASAIDSLSRTLGEADLAAVRRAS